LDQKPRADRGFLDLILWFWTENYDFECEEMYGIAR